jgi:hypothetical protein
MSALKTIDGANEKHGRQAEHRPDGGFEEPELPLLVPAAIAGNKIVD